MNDIRARFKLERPDFSLEIDVALPGSGISALFGPSGAGKTSVLRAIAGLDRARSGYIEVNGSVWQDDARGFFMPTHERPLGFVFQEASLFSHLSVRRNLEYGMKRVAAARRRVSLEHAVELLGIAPLMERSPESLSGGERQRAAIARALATSPSLLLLDEPLAALDIKLKFEIIPYLERLHDELEIPVLYVSHTPDEVARLADHLVLLERGRVAASGPLGSLLTRLDLPFAGGDGAGVWIEGIVAGYEANYHLLGIAFPGGQFHLPGPSRREGSRVRLRIQARDVSLSLEKRTDSSIINILPARLLEMRDEAPGQVMVVLALGDSRLLCRVTRKSADALGLHPGKAVYAQVKGVAIVD
jgi:molybdate transport system ATP-binding protein